MNLKLQIPFRFIMLLGVILSCSGFFKRCDRGSPCIFLGSCPRMKRTSLEIVRQNICGFEERNAKVCCPPEPSTTTTSRTLTFVLGNQDKESLLPKRCGRPTSDDRIVNGSPAPIGAYPWMAALGYTQPGVTKLQFICAGSLITSRYVLTAAHCLDPAELGRRKLSVIHLGDWDLSTNVDCQEATDLGTRCNGPHIVAGFESTVSHPSYNKRGQSSDDIALIRLNTNIDFANIGNIEAVCLPPKNFNFKSFAGDRKPVAAGWGLTEHGNNSNILLRVDVPIADDELCNERYQKNFVGNQLCIGGSDEGFDTCSGDSGGPLVMTHKFGPPFVQVGIVSFGPFPCGLQKFPGVYTSVGDYRDWILDNLKP